VVSGGCSWAVGGRRVSVHGRWALFVGGGVWCSWVDSDDSTSSLSDDAARLLTCHVVIHLPYRIVNEDDRSGKLPTWMHPHHLDDVARTVDVPRRHYREPSTRRVLVQPLGAGDVALPPRCRPAWYVPWWWWAVGDGCGQ
jgi:hypothetical protein